MRIPIWITPAQHFCPNTDRPCRNKSHTWDKWKQKLKGEGRHDADMEKGTSIKVSRDRHGCGERKHSGFSDTEREGDLKGGLGFEGLRFNVWVLVLGFDCCFAVIELVLKAFWWFFQFHLLLLQSARMQLESPVNYTLCFFWISGFFHCDKLAEFLVWRLVFWLKSKKARDFNWHWACTH